MLLHYSECKRDALSGESPDEVNSRCDQRRRAERGASAPGVYPLWCRRTEALGLAGCPGTRVTQKTPLIFSARLRAVSLSGSG
jgi:hypothetical protein